MRRITARDLMNPEVLTVPEDLTVAKLAAFLLDNEISGAPVVDRHGKLMGVVSVVDIVQVASVDANAGGRHPDFLSRGREGRMSPAEIDELRRSGRDLVARDIMTPGVFSVADDASVSEVALTMLKEHLHRVLVVAGDEVVGIIATSDLLGLLVDVD